MFFNCDNHCVYYTWHGYSLVEKVEKCKIRVISTDIAQAYLIFLSFFFLSFTFLTFFIINSLAFKNKNPFCCKGKCALICWKDRY